MAKPPEKKGGGGSDVPAPPPQQLAVELPAELLREIETRLAPQIGGLPPDVQHRVVEQTVQMTAQFSGPIPPDFVLRGYETILPGATDRIIAMAEREQLHSHGEDRRASLYPLIAELSGKIAGALVTVIAICASAFVIVSGQPIAGSIMGGATIGAVALALIKSQRSEPKPPPAQNRGQANRRRR